MVKAAFFDIDGTLVSFNTHKIPESTLYALEELKRKGVKCFIATGRSWNQLQKVKDFPQFDGYILLNGSCCMTGENQIIYCNCINQSDLEALTEFHETHAFPVEFVYADYELMTETNDLVCKAWANVDMEVPPVKPMRECDKNSVYQLGVFLSREEELEMNIVDRFMPNCESMRWSPDFFDIIPKGSKKSVGIDKIISHYGIKLEETIAFGDGGNDIDMIRYAGIGVAMGNAGDEVKSAADFVTTSVDCDGILNALKTLEIL